MRGAWGAPTSAFRCCAATAAALRSPAARRGARVSRPGRSQAPRSNRAVGLRCTAHGARTAAAVTSAGSTAEFNAGDAANATLDEGEANTATDTVAAARGFGANASPASAGDESSSAARPASRVASTSSGTPFAPRSERGTGPLQRATTVERRDAGCAAKREDATAIAPRRREAHATRPSRSAAPGGVRVWHGCTGVRKSTRPVPRRCN